MRINHIGPKEISRRKTVSDLKNDTELESFANTRLSSSRGEAYRAVRDKEDKILMTNLHTMSDEDYFEELWNSVEV